MSRLRFEYRGTASVVVGVVLSFAAAFDVAAAAPRIQVTIEAAKQGVLKGDASGKIAATAVSIETQSPRDAASGQVSGKVQNLPVTITKPLDGASPQLFQALVTNELLKSVTIEFYAGDAATGQETITQTIRLTNASVANLRQTLDAPSDPAASAAAEPYETVALTYQSIEFPGGASPPPAPPTPTRLPTRVKREPAPAPLDPVERPAPTRIPRR